MATVEMSRVDPLKPRHLPHGYRNIPRGGSRPHDKFDEMYKARVISGQVPGDAELRKQKMEVSDVFKS
jgi:hypothetical protein